VFSAIYFTHLFPLVEPPNINILLALEAIKQDIAKTTIKVNFDSGYDFLKDIGFCRAWSFGPS
jgi:hypothetical protein